MIASLVQGVYILEHDRQKNRLGTKSLSPPWWEFFHFHLHNVLVDSADFSMFGAILELRLPPNYPKTFALNTPKYVIAFRVRAETRSRDILLDLKWIVNTLHKSSRFKLAMHSIQNTIDIAGSDNVWLAGDSLGSAIALLAGKNMSKKGYNLPTYLFNSPFTSAPLERINHQKITQGIHIASSVMKVGISAALKGHHHHHDHTSHDEHDDPFAELSTWVPHLFVNPGDHICSGYINYFAEGEVEKIGARKIEKIATKCTLESLLSDALDRNSEPLHLLPSLELNINMGHTSGFRAAHGIEQWWDPHLRFKSLMYLYK